MPIEIVIAGKGSGVAVSDVYPRRVVCQANQNVVAHVDIDGVAASTDQDLPSA